MNLEKQAHNMAVEIETIKKHQMFTVIDILLSQGRITEEEAKEAKNDADKTFALNISGNPFVPSAGGKKVEAIIIEENRKLLLGMFDKLKTHNKIGKDVSNLLKGEWIERRDLVTTIITTGGGLQSLISSLIECPPYLICIDTQNFQSNFAKYRLTPVKVTCINVKFDGLKTAYILSSIPFDKNTMLVVAGD